MKGGCSSSHAFCTDHRVSASGFEADDDILHLLHLFNNCIRLDELQFCFFDCCKYICSDGLFFTIRLGYEVTKNGIYCVGVVRLVHLSV